MKLGIIIFSCVLVVAINICCKSKNNRTLVSKTLDYDTNLIAIFHWDTTKSVFPSNSDPLALTQRDIRLVDSLLRVAVDSTNISMGSMIYEIFNKHVAIDSFLIRLENCKLQFFPYRDVNGQRVVRIIAFKKHFTQWRTKIYSGTFHYGTGEMMLWVNLSTRKYDELYAGGFG